MCEYVAADVAEKIGEKQQVSANTVVCGQSVAKVRPCRAASSYDRRDPGSRTLAASLKQRVSPSCSAMVCRGPADRHVFREVDVFWYRSQPGSPHRDFNPVPAVRAPCTRNLHDLSVNTKTTVDQPIFCLPYARVDEKRGSCRLVKLNFRSSPSCPAIAICVPP